jgi:pimeloyl-ACP methyl ester carboxylesterase
MTTWCDQRCSVDATAGVELAWGERGQGRPLVLVHGWTGSAHDFTLHTQALSAHRRVLAIDHRGHGHSTNTDNAGSYSVERLALDLQTWADTVVGEPFDLLGHSMGGRVVLELALARPDLVRSLILMDTTAWRMDIGMPNLERWLTSSSDDDIRNYLLTPENKPEDIAIRAAVPPGWIADNMANKAGVDPKAARQLGLQIFTEESQTGDRLHEITCPVTVIAGEFDHPFIDHAPALANGVAHGRLTVIDGAWHSPQLTHPEAWRAAVNDHLSRV